MVFIVCIDKAGLPGYVTNEVKDFPLERRIVWRSEAKPELQRRCENLLAEIHFPHRWQ